MPEEGSPKRRLRVPWRAAAPSRPPPPAAETPRGLANPLRAQFEQRSLFGEILDWMLAPLLLLWPMSVTVTYIVAQSIANAPFDRSLADAVGVLANHLHEAGGEVVLQLPMSAREVLRADASDTIYYMALGLRGELIAGDNDLPLPPEDARPTAREVQFRSDLLRGNEIRIAYTWVEFNREGRRDYAFVEVAETLEKRSQLANEILRGVIIPQFIVLPIAVVLVWFGLTRGLAPLADLQARIRARQPDDLSPIDARGAPEEIGPLVSSFNELLERLALNLQMQRHFLADAAHQMKTPLAGLRTQAELALRETDPQELKRTLRYIATSTERATHLINQLLALARAEYQASDPSAFQVVDLEPLARDLVRDLVPDAIRRGVDLGFEGADGPAMTIAAPVLLSELLKNLVDNALRYTPRGGSVTVRVARRSGSVFLEVEDNGPGIPEHERQRVFDRFYRILGTGVDGSGLGLSIVREIAHQHGALVRISDPENATAERPGTLVSVEFEALDMNPPTVDLTLR
ncbi:MAG TPA: sensor histidine kinase N-terminal domain-containing protein [Burkholderiaceae bacterium]|nr:sensor histidine kinase N-terminal domain-containing protein [Burkholderiaceae bacterium]